MATTQQKRSASPSKLAAYLGKGFEILQALGYDYLPRDHNPIWLALAGLAPIPDEQLDELVDSGVMTGDEAKQYQQTSRHGQVLADKLRLFLWNNGKPQKSATLQAYVLAQTACLNEVGGPVEDGALGTIRQRWYFSKVAMCMGFKFAAQALEQYLVTSADVVLVLDERERQKAYRQGARDVRFRVNWSKDKEQELAESLGRPVNVHIWPKEGWGRSYAKGQSAILADLIRSGLTYEELWIRDASRDSSTFSPLVRGFHGILIVEKQGLFSHFEPFCKAAGIPILLAMAGNNAFSGVEALLNDNLRDYEGAYRPTPDNPLHVFSISDHDYAGHVPVQNGAVAQFERYLPGAVKLHRVGITPQQLRDLGRSIVSAGYEFDADHNSAYREWADTEGIWVGDVCYGIEVEALMPSEYVPYLIDAIVEAVGGDEELRKRLARMAEPSWYTIVQALSERIWKESELWKRLVALGEWANEKRNTTEETAQHYPDTQTGTDYDDNSWRNSQAVKDAVAEVVSRQTDDLSVDDFKSHVRGKSWSAWSPLRGDAANDKVIEMFIEQFGEQMAAVASAIDGGAGYDDYPQFDSYDQEWDSPVAEMAGLFYGAGDLLRSIREVFELLAGHDLAFDDDF